MNTITGRRNNSRKAVVLGLTALGVAFAAIGAETVTYDTSPYWSPVQGIFAGFGVDSATAVGNTFIAPTDSVVTLKDFTFYGRGYPVRPSASLNLRPFVYEWTGNLFGRGGGMQGSPIYFGDSFQYTVDASRPWWPLTANIDGGGVKLIPGQAYVLGFTTLYTTEYWTSTGNVEFQFVPARNRNYNPPPIPPGVDFGSGGAVWLNGSVLDVAPWDTWGDIGTFAFTAHFTVLTAPPGPPQITCPEPLTLECDQGSASGTLTAGVLDTNGLPVEVIWTADGAPVQTNEIPSGETITQSNVTFTASFADGEHTVVISASNGETPPVTCSNSVTVADTLPPEISSISASPDSLWPPNHKLVPITVTVTATDQCDPAPTATITQITCNEPVRRFERDWIITAPLSAELRAERSGNTDRVYTIYVLVTDSSGNSTTGTVLVTVPGSFSESRHDGPAGSRGFGGSHRDIR